MRAEISGIVDRAHAAGHGVRMDIERLAGGAPLWRRCPVCGEAGIAVWSVRWPSIDTARWLASGNPFSRCQKCGAGLRYQGRDELMPVSDGEWSSLRPSIVTTPPWVVPGVTADFQLSWDVTEAFFRDLAVQLPYVAPLGSLLAELRPVYGPRLRVGQSVMILILSRAREHGLTPNQSHLDLYPRQDGALDIIGVIAGHPVGTATSPVRPACEGLLAGWIEQLAAEPLQ